MTRIGTQDWLSPRQCAVRIGVSSAFIRGEIRDGRLHGSILERHGKRPMYRVATADFATYLTIHWNRLVRTSQSAQSE